MLLTVSHLSSYRYDRQVPYALQRLRLWPTTGPGQIVLRWEVNIEGAVIETTYSDGFGNRTALVRHDRTAEEILIRAAGEVETQSRDGVFGLGSGQPPTWVFERQTDLTHPGAAIRGSPPTLATAPTAWRCCTA